MKRYSSLSSHLFPLPAFPFSTTLSRRKFKLLRQSSLNQTEQCSGRDAFLIGLTLFCNVHPTQLQFNFPFPHLPERSDGPSCCELCNHQLLWMS